jgi:hypothetical protein
MMFLTFALSIIWNVEIGIVVSLIISLLLVIRRSSKTRMTILVSPPLSPSVLSAVHERCGVGAYSWYRPVEARDG